MAIDQAGTSRSNCVTGMAGDGAGGVLNRLLAGSQVTHELHVAGVPVTMTNRGFRNILERFGVPLDCMVFCQNQSASNDLTWGKVTFGSELEAMNAVRGLDRKPPWNFRVSTAMTPEERITRRKEEQERDKECEEQIRRTEAFYRTSGLGKQDYDVDGVVKPLEGRLERLQDFAREKRWREPSTSELYRQFSNELAMGYSSSGDVNDVWSQRVKRSALPSGPFNCDGQELSKPFRFGYPISVPKGKGLQTCLFCQGPGRVRCARCKSYYCSQTCQADDWPMHRSNCVPPPPLEKPDGMPYRPPSVTLRRSPKPVDVKPASSADVARERVPKEVVVAPGNEKADGQRALEESKVESSALPADVDLSLAMYQKTYLDDAKAGDVITFVTNFDSKVSGAMGSVVSTPAVFAATVVGADDSSGYILQAIPSQFDELKAAGKVGMTASQVVPGRAVVSTELADETFASRFICLDCDGGSVSLYEVDRPCRLDYKLSDVSLSPKAHCGYASHGFKFSATGNLDSSLLSLIRKMSVEAMTAKVKSVRKFNDGRLKSVSVTLLSKDQQPLMTYNVIPWFRCNPSVSSLLKVPDEVVKLVDLSRLNLSVGDKVLKTTFREWSDMIVVIKAEMVEKMEELRTVLQQECATPNPLAKLAVQGQIVACKWSTDGLYYRVVVRAVNQELKKVRVRFIDYGNEEVEPFENMFEVPDKALGYPCFALPVTVHGVEGNLCLTKKENQMRMKTLDPLLSCTLEVIDCIDNKHVLKTPNGKTLGQIISDKINEKEEDRSKGEVQGMEVCGQFHLDRCLSTELSLDEAAAEQSVIVLYVGSPTEIYVCPENQVGLASSLLEQIRNYVAAVESSFRGFRPEFGRMCLAKASDEQWYRAACLKHLPAVETDSSAAGQEEEEKFLLFFADYGFQEPVAPVNILKVTDELMKTPLLANHCILDGFVDEGDDAAAVVELCAGLLKEKLPEMDSAKIRVVGKSDAAFVIRIPDVSDEVLAARGDKNAKSSLQKQPEVPIVATPAEAEVTKSDVAPVETKDIETSSTDVRPKRLELEVDPSRKQEVSIAHAESPKEVYVIPIDGVELLLRVMNKLALPDGAKEGEFVPSVGQLCAAQSKEDGLWYRGVCLKVEESEVAVDFVDFGFKEVVTTDRLKSIDDDIAKVPFLACRCILHQFEDASMTEKFVESCKPQLQSIMSRTLPVTVLKKFGDAYVVKLEGVLEGVSPPPPPSTPVNEAGKEGPVSDRPSSGPAASAEVDPSELEKVEKIKRQIAELEKQLAETTALK